MFESLSGRLGDVFEKLRRRGSLSASDIDAAMRDVRVALLEADVALPVVRSFIDRVKNSAQGQDVLKSVTPGQMIIKIVHDELVETLGAETTGIDLNAPAPVGIMLVGLQGSGKTTTTAKIAARLKDRERKKVLMASLDTQRPAAQEQLKVLGEQAGVVDTLPVVCRPTGPGRHCPTCRAMQRRARRLRSSSCIDTAGRIADRRSADERSRRGSERSRSA